MGTMTEVTSHPVRITDRDLLKEQSVTAWYESFKDYDLHVRIRNGRRLIGADRSGYSDPYCVLKVGGKVRRRTVEIRHTLNPEWNEEFILDWRDVQRGRKLLEFEVYDWDFWTPDELLGQAELDLLQLSFEPNEVVQRTLKLLPSASARKQREKERQARKAAAIAKQRQQLDQAQKRAKAAASKDQKKGKAAVVVDGGKDTAAEPDDAADGAGPFAAAQRERQLQHEELQLLQQQQLAAAAEDDEEDLGEINISLWWASSHSMHSAHATEVCSFTLKPGEKKTPPQLAHARCGTMYEEPCIMYIKLTVIEIWLGDLWKSTLATLSTKKPIDSELMEAWDDGDDAGSGSDVAVAGDGNGVLPESAVYALVRLNFGKHQQQQSQPVRVRQSGMAVVREAFVFVAKRPLKDKQVVLEVELKSITKERVVSRTTYSLLELLQHSPPMPTTWMAVHKARSNRGPGAAFPLGNMENGHVHLTAHAADADCRALVFQVPPSARVSAPGKQNSKKQLLRQLSARILRRHLEPQADGSDESSADVHSGSAVNKGTIATLQVAVQRFDLSECTERYHFVMKCGPHWIKSVPLVPGQDSSVGWELHFPVYHPTTTLRMVLFTTPQRGQPSFVGELQYRLAMALSAQKKSDQFKVLKLYGDQRDRSGRRLCVGTASLVFNCTIPDRQALRDSYQLSPYPPEVHYISLLQTVSKDVLRGAYQGKVAKWLEQRDPPVSEDVSRRVMRSQRDQFNLTRARTNVQRIRVVLQWTVKFRMWHQSIKEWRYPRRNLTTLVAAYCVCFHPRLSFVLYVVWRGVLCERRILAQVSSEFLGLELSEYLDIDDDDWPDYLDDDGEEDDKENSLGSMLFQPKRLQALRRRYDRLVRLALMTQNRMDDIASLFERLVALATGQDPIASAWWYTRLLALALAVYFLGPGMVLFLWVCGEMKPPSWRSAPGIKGPIPFLQNLPSRCTDDV